MKITKYNIIEVLANNYFLPAYLHVTPEVQSKNTGMKKKNSRREISIFQ